MNISWERIAPWMMALAALVILPGSVILILMNPAGHDERVWEFLTGAVFGCGAPILGLVILRHQPRNRIGWLWLVIGLTIAFGSLSQGLKYYTNSNPSTDYSSLIFTILLFSETAYILRFICLMLLMLWFPDGKPPTPRWRILHLWVVLSFILLTLELFAQKVPWSNVEGLVRGAPLVDNPIGFLPVALSPIYELMAPIGFLSIVGMSLLAALAMLLRYRSATQQVRAQILWFAVGGVIYASSFVASIALIDYSTLLPGVLTNLAILPFYLAIGIAITRYQLYDISVFIRRTLQYSLVTAVLALVYFGSVTVLQSLFASFSGQQSTLAIVLSTLAIAALFNPLRRRVQAAVDQRFYRQKYDADQALSDFAAAARSQADLSQLVEQLNKVVQLTIQPASVSIWLYSLNTPRQPHTPVKAGSTPFLPRMSQIEKAQRAPGFNPLLAGGLLLIVVAAMLFIYQIIRQNAAQRLEFDPLPLSENIRPVIIDTDMAPDDWMAILFLLKRPEIDVLAITVSGTGEAHCEPGVRNTLGLLALAGRSGIPVACGQETPLEGNHVFPDDWRSNADTMSGLELPQVELPAGDEGAVDLLTRLALESPRKVSILTLGPLTNLAQSVQQEPALVERVETVVIMGGALAVPGNVGFSGADIDNQIAEWNFYIDPLAVKIVFGSGLPVLLVPLDATNDVPLGSVFFRMLKANRRTPEAEFVYQVLAKMQDFIASGRYYFWDPLAAGLLVDPSLGAITEGKVKVFTAEGPNSGLVRVMADGNPIRYATSAERDRFYDEFLRTLNQP